MMSNKEAAQEYSWKGRFDSLFETHDQTMKNMMSETSLLSTPTRSNVKIKDCLDLLQEVYRG